ncbi:MAG: phenylalanine--tRNA ligase subunit beta, partial [Candidatus Omnitrophica bacterium]|nr:phenylalanine--tRNA ligase subunit beta [Candidatus Omnitrophota bacterium]
MKAPIEWVKEFVAVRLPAEELAHRLTMAGSEVVGISRAGGEPALDFEITPNRPDCLSIIGIAREVAAITGQKLKLPPRTSSLEPRTPLRIRIEDRKGCRRYIGRLIEGVRLGPSPSWMQKRLEACGLRPINNIVDITNYVLLEYGQPLHAFDYRRLAEGTILVRRARANEKLAALDGNAYSLSSEDLVIADATRPVAVAGVVGGQDSAVNEHTTTMLLESAHFDPLIVRRTARRLGMATESSYRFERGVDPAGVGLASWRAAQLIIEIAGGREVGVKDVGERTTKRTVMNLESARLQGWLGASVPPSRVKRTLESLGCAVRPSRGGWRITPPTFRRDLQQDVDLIEELARVVGYERIPGTLPSAVIGTRRGGRTSYQASYELRNLCAGLGLSELMTW